MSSSGTFRFLIVFSLLLLPVWFYYAINKTKNHEALNQAILLRTDAQRIFAGGSSISFAIRDSNNIADLSEPYIFTFKKIQLLKPKKVFLSVGINYFLKHYDKVYENGLLTKTSYQYLSTMLSEEEACSINQLMTFETRAFNGVQKILPIIGTKMTTEDRSRILGGNYYAGSISKTNEFIFHTRIEEMFPNGDLKWSDVQWLYFERILSYCKEHNIEVILLTTPLNQRFHKQFPESAQSDYENKLNTYIQTYHLLHADYTLLPMDDSYFFDGDHLNDMGADYFMSFIQGNPFFK